MKNHVYTNYEATRDSTLSLAWVNTAAGSSRVLASQGGCSLSGAVMLDLVVSRGCSGPLKLQSVLRVSECHPGCHRAAASTGAA
jgi:hypothetical protein